VTVEWIEANGQAAVLILRDGSVVALATVNASEKGIDQILWIMRPSKLNAVLRAERIRSNAYPSESAVS
jgi:hypothetical protein